MESVSVCDLLLSDDARASEIAEGVQQTHAVATCGRTWRDGGDFTPDPSSTAGFNWLRSAPCQGKHRTAALCTVARAHWRRTETFPASSLTAR